MPGIPPSVQFTPRPPETVTFYPTLVPVQDTAPATSAMAWVDTSTIPPTIRGWSGTEWVPLTAAGTGGGDPGAGGPVLYTFSRSGALAVKVGGHRLYNDTGTVLAVTSVRAAVGAAPFGGGAVTVDVNLDGTSIFTTPADRPSVPVGANTSAPTTLAATWPPGAYLSVDIDQVGVDPPGSDLTVTVTATPET
jgi:hypothetical protein